jgi:hypothetical protein
LGGQCRRGEQSHGTYRRLSAEQRCAFLPSAEANRFSSGGRSARCAIKAPLLSDAFFTPFEHTGGQTDAHRGCCDLELRLACACDRSGEILMGKIRLNIEVSQELADVLDSLADAEGTTRTELVRRGITVLKAYKEQREVGRPHLGFTKDPLRLDAEMLGILSSQVGAATTPGYPSVSTAAVSPPPASLSTMGSGSDPVSMEVALSRWTIHRPQATHMKV